MLNKYIQEAYKVLNNEKIDKELAVKLSMIDGEDVMDLLSLANKVKNKFSPDTHVCTIMNVKSGMCNEDCSFCSQSLHNNAEIERYRLVSKDKIIERAKEAYQYDIKTFALVTSGTGYKNINNSEFKKLIDSFDEIRNHFPEKKVCASIGLLSDDTAKILSEHINGNYNINLQTSVDSYGRLISKTHSSEDRIETIKLLQKYGIGVCSGGIIGVGETMEERIDLAFTLNELDVKIIPLNVLIPIEGTPLENQDEIPVIEIAKTFALFRLINPTKYIKFAAGRETKMKDYQALLMLSGANGYLTGGYLTTRGREVADDEKFKQELDRFSFSIIE